MGKLEGLYSRLNKENGERVCTDITDEACEKAPHNFFTIISCFSLSSIADALSNPKTVMAWLMSYVNAPLFLISFIVPIRESGAMLPQIFIAHLIRKKKIRKSVWLLGGILQAVSMLAIALFALYFEGFEAGLLIVVALIVFSFSRALSSVASKDVLGKTIPKTRRGRLQGLVTSVSGSISMIAGLFLLFLKDTGDKLQYYVGFIFLAALLWFIGALLFSQVKEFPEEYEEDKSGAKAVMAKLSLLKTDTKFRNFIITRSLLLCSALTAPYYVIFAQNNLGDSPVILGLFIVSNGLASIISAPFWGKKADESSKSVMMRAALITASLGFLFIFCIESFAFLKSSFWFYPLAFFVLGIAHSGVRLGRKTYIVDMASGKQRTDYVSVSNTIIGLILLIAGGIGALVSLISLNGIVIVLSSLGLFGALMAYKLPEV